MSRTRLLTASVLLLIVAACSASEPAPESSGAAAPAPLATVDGTPEPAAETPAPVAEAAPAPASAPGNPLLSPDADAMNRRAPDLYRARFRTSKGDFVVEVHRDWSPRGADRFYNLVDAGYYDDMRFFRVIDGFVAQFGMHGDPDVTAAWSWAEMRDDPVKESNRPGTITFATGGKDTRTTQVFINVGDNRNLDSMGFSPFGEVVEGMDVVRSLYSGYGDGAPYGQGPDQGAIQDRGNAYLDAEFPRLDRILQARIE